MPNDAFSFSADAYNVPEDTFTATTDPFTSIDDETLRLAEDEIGDLRLTESREPFQHTQRYLDKQAAFERYKADGGALGKQAWGKKYDALEKARTAKAGAVHGNTAGNQPATLYERYDAEGNFLKHGVSQDPSARYTAKELDGGFLVETQTGPRKNILKIERELVETNPGPLNKEPWAGKRRGK